MKFSVELLLTDTYPKIGSRPRESKNHNGSIKYASNRARKIRIHDIDVLSGKHNVFRLIHEYFKARKEENLSYILFFLGTNRKNKNTASKYFKQQPIGRITMLLIVKEVRSSLGIREGVCENVTTHRLRATMISLLTSAGD